MGQTEEGVLRIFFALKNPTVSAGFEPATLGSEGQHATSRPPKPLSCSLSYSAFNAHAPYCHLLPVLLDNIISNRVRFSKKKTKHEMCVSIFSIFSLRYFSFQEEQGEILSQMCIGLHVKYPLFLSHFNET
jgi:hypothetical protein